MAGPARPQGTWTSRPSRGPVLVVVCLLLALLGSCTAPRPSSDPDGAMPPERTVLPGPGPGDVAEEPLEELPGPQFPLVTPPAFSPGPVPSDRPIPGRSPGQNTADTILAECAPGRIAFRPPSPMKVGETEQFVLRVVLAGSPTDPSSTFPGESPGARPVETANPTVCDRMRAELTGPAFSIDQMGNESGKMLVPEEGFGEWRWYITARETGQQSLILRLYAIGPEDEDITLETFERTIEVEVDAGTAVAGFLKEWAIPLGLTIPVALGGVGALFTRSRRRSHRSRPADTSA